MFSTLLFLCFFCLSWCVDDDPTIFENVHLVDEVGDNKLFRGAIPVDRETEQFSFSMLQRSLHVAALAENTRLPEVYRVVVVNLIGLSNLEVDGARKRCTFLHEHNAGAAESRFDNDPEHNRAALLCFEKAVQFGIHASDLDVPVQHNQVEKCDMPRHWFALPIERFLYYCNPISRQMIKGHKLSKIPSRVHVEALDECNDPECHPESNRKQRNNKPIYNNINDNNDDDNDDNNFVAVDNNRARNVLLKSDDEKDAHNVDAPTSLAKQLYSNRHEKDFARVVHEWRFFDERRADDEYWYMPLHGTHLNIDVLLVREPAFAQSLAESLASWGIY
jgi:hypothetical protein